MREEEDDGKTEKRGEEGGGEKQRKRRGKGKAREKLGVPQQGGEVWRWSREVRGEVRKKRVRK